ncbi:MAG: cytochrome c peroxidase, partial [Bacteroidota bacterium]
MKSLATAICLVVGFTFIACTNDHLSGQLDYALLETLDHTSGVGDFRHYILPDENDLTQIPQDPANPLSQVKVELGRFLFFETGLAQGPNHESGRGSYSCATCHVPAAGFVPGRLQGIADGGIGFGENGELRDKSDNYLESELDVQGARPLSLFNVALVNNTSWNGQFGANDANAGTEELWHNSEATEVNEYGFKGLESQNIEGLKLHRMVVNKDIVDSLGYTDLYDDAFGFLPEENRYNIITASFAISAYLRSLITSEAPFQQFLKGKHDAMSLEEKEGAMLFFGKAGCFHCHNSASLNNSEAFYALGVKDLYQTGAAFNTGPDDQRNFGRGGFTLVNEDYYKYKVPQLYNMKNADFFFHGSSKNSMREVVEYFNAGIPEN